MKNKINTTLRNPYLWICSIDWLLAQSHLLVHDVYSNNPIFDLESHDVEYWVRDLSWKIRGFLWLSGLFIVPLLVLHKIFVPTLKNFMQLAAYTYVFTKDIYDWFTKTNYNSFNTGTFIYDNIILMALLLFIELSFDLNEAIRKLKNKIKP